MNMDEINAKNETEWVLGNRNVSSSMIKRVLASTKFKLSIFVLVRGNQFTNEVFHFME